MLKILVIDEETPVHHEVMEWLELEGHKAVAARDEMSALDYAAVNDLDLVICDITGPILNGRSVLLEIRSNPLTANIPFIFVTLEAVHQDVRRKIADDADDFLTKPYTREQLLQAVVARMEKIKTHEQKQKAQIEELERALASEHEDRLVQMKLAAMFTHDFRNSLTSIQASNTLMRDYADRMDEKRRIFHINQIGSSVKLLFQMLDETLLTAEIQTRKFQVNRESCQLQQFIRDIVEEFQYIYSVTHRLIFVGNFFETIMIDVRLMRQIAANLVSNAIKYSPRGSEIRVILDTDGDQIALTVQDQGIGISETDQINIFDGFKRGSNVGKITGTGLGLAIVKQAVELLRGSIELKSQVDVGTTISVLLPLISS